MSIMQKLLNLFKLPDATNSATSVQIAATYTPNPKMDQYYKRESIKKENNLNITYQDVSCYDMKPFDLKHPFINNGHFTCIALSGHNLDLAYHYLQVTNELIQSFHKYYLGTALPTGIKTDQLYEKELPVSHLRLTPYTSTMRKCKYPFYLWLQDFGDYGDMYLYRLYFDQNGTFKKGDLSFNNQRENASFQIQIRNDGFENYVRRIDRTLYIEPYGTTTLYIDDKRGK